MKFGTLIISKERNGNLNLGCPMLKRWTLITSFFSEEEREGELGVGGWVGGGGLVLPKQ